MNHDADVAALISACVRETIDVAVSHLDSDDADLRFNCYGFALFRFVADATSDIDAARRAEAEFRRVTSIVRRGHRLIHGDKSVAH